MEFDGERYRYVHSLQGDIIAIVDSAGNTVVEYKYDAWGKRLRSADDLEIGRLNPFRYRGCVWDEEGQLCYLENRYYRAEINRFISSDCTTYLLSSDLLECNAYAYCSNNPIVLYDPTGAFSLSTLFKVAVATVVVAACIVASAAVATTVTAAFLPAAAATAAGKIAAVATGASVIGGAVDGAISAKVDGGDLLNGAMAGAMGNAVGSVISSVGCGSNPDMSHRWAIAGRAAGSVVYDFVYDCMEQERYYVENIPFYIADATMDAAISTVTYGYSGGVRNDIAQAMANCAIDGGVDVLQTKAVKDNRRRNSRTAAQKSTTRSFTARMAKDEFIYGL